MAVVDIVIPTYNNREELGLCLQSFRSQTFSDFRVLVCIDGSTDDTTDFLKDHRSFGYEMEVLEHPDKKNKGRSATRNLSLPRLSSAYVIFLDSDFTVRGDFIETHLNVLQTLDAISVGEISYEKGNIWRDYALSRGKHKFQTHLAEIPFKYLETGNVMLPTNVFSELNGFDEEFSGYGGEDTELACRIWKRYGLKTVFNRRAIAYGKMEKPLEIALSQREDFASTGLRYIRSKHPDLPEVFNLKFLESPAAATLYRVLPQKVLLQIAESNLPKAIRLKAVHLLVFSRMFKGYHRK